MNKKKKIRKIISFVFIIFVFIIGTCFLVKQIFKDNTDDMLINISELPEEFMDNYFEEYNELEKEEKENMLIAISSEKINAQDYGAKEVIEAPNNKYYILFEDDLSKEKAIIKLNEEESVKSVEENITRKILVTENKRNTQSNEIYNSWGIQAMGLDYAMKEISNLETNEVTIAILDTGLDVNLFNKYYPGRIKSTYNVLPGNEDTSMYDNLGHGTHIAGTIAEGTPDNIKIIPVKISDSEVMLESDILAALEYITYYAEVDVINMSFGGYEYSMAEYQAIEAARQKNIIAVTAAGNDNTLTPMYPAAFDNTISIASVDSNLIKSEFPNYGNTINFATPGTDINSIMASYMKISENEDGDDDHETISGTSMAAPHASSAVAILKSINKEITLANTVDLLKNIAVDLGGKGFDMYYGNGFINYSDVHFCTNEEMNGDEFNIFKVIKPINMIIDEVTYTSYNYGSLSNIMGTKVYFEEVDGLDYTKELWELEDLTITGYDPYNNDEQIVTAHYLDLEISFVIDNPENYESGWEYQVYNEKYYLSNYKDNGLKIGKLYLPEKIDELTISGILNSNDGNSILFNNSDDCNYFEKIVLPSNIIEVGSYAFTRLPKCTNVISKASEIKVNKGSFSNMTNLTAIEGNIVFTETSSSVFENNIYLKNVTISENTSDMLPENSFRGCTSLKSISLPNVITTIDGFAFYESGLVSIELSDSLKIIGADAFYNSKLESIKLPNSLEEIRRSSFSHNNLKVITIPKNVNFIDNGAFSFNPLLDRIMVAEENEFYDSRNDSNLIIETSTNKIIQGSNNATIPNSVVTIGNTSFMGLSIEELEVPEGITSIEENAFMHADFLEKIILPNSLTNIHSSVFSYYENIDEQKLLGAASSGCGTGIGTTVLWVNEDSYAYNFAVNNDKTYVIIGDSSDTVKITKITYMLKKSSFYPEEKLEDYIDWIKYEYIEGEEVFETEVQNFTVEYQNSDSISINDYAAFIKFDLEHSYKNIKMPIFFNVVDGKSEIELPIIEAVLGDYVGNYEFPDGTFSAYTGTSYNEVGEYKLLGDYTLKDTGETYYSVEVTVRVLDKELVYNFAQHIYAKTYDGTTTVNPNNVVLHSYRSNIAPFDYTIVSAELNSPEVSPKTLVKIKARINDDSYEKFAFSGNKQEIEFTGYMAVIDFEIPEVTLLIGETFYSHCNDEGCLKSYNLISFEEAGDYTIGGYYSFNDGSGIIYDILIPVHVINKQFVESLAEISPKEYDGTTNVDFNTITLPNIDKSDYTILSAELESPDVNEWGAAIIKVKLNDTFYENYAFTGNKQESEWYNDIEITKATPKYDVPQDLKAELGQSLYDISLPKGFEWTSENEVFNEAGNKTYEAKYTPDDIVNYKIIENIKITINVSLKTYTITYNSNDENNLTSIQEVEQNKQTKLKENTFERKGFEFIGWNTNADGTGTNYSDKQEISINENLILYAQWKEAYSYIINKYSYDDNNKYIDQIEINTTVDDFKKNIVLNTGYSIDVSYKTIDGKNLLYTGSKTKIYNNNNLIIEYTNIIRGDVNGDGKINYLDYVNVYNHIQKVKHPELDKKELQNEYLVSANMSGDDKVNYLDYVQIYNKIKELKGGK